MSVRTAKGTFAKGTSGNPGGRHKGVAEVVDLARSHSAMAISTLASIAQNPKAPEAARISASVALLDRAWGKPVQMAELTGKDGGPIETADVSAVEVARRLAFLLANGLAAAQAGEG